MKLSISNIAWDNTQDEHILSILNEYGFSGLEIAPTRVFPDEPYKTNERVHLFKTALLKQYHLEISSIQSIWYGRTENMFDSPSDRTALLNYTKEAIDFARILDCKNLVFGNPKARSIKKEAYYKDDAFDFFKELSEYAELNHTTLSLEANPSPYGTNFMTSTQEVLSFVKMVNCSGFKVNLDIGAMIMNNEDLDLIANNIEWINHVHISEPFLEPIKKRNLHIELFNLLKSADYNKFISIEMKKCDNLDTIKSILNYIKIITQSR